jgi:hypothetical protein
MDALRKILLFVSSLVVGVYTAFVAMCMWNWFAVEALHAPPVSFLQALGLIWLVGLIRGEVPAADPRWQRLFTILEVHTPAEKSAQLADALKKWEKDLWMDVGAAIYLRVLGNTLTLLLAFGLHILIGP